MWYWISVGFGIWVFLITLVLLFMHGAYNLSTPKRKDQNER